MIEPQLLDLPFAGGIDERTSPKWLAPGSKQKGVLNGVFSINGVISKRYGFSPLSQSSAPTVPPEMTRAPAPPLRLAARGKELLMVDGDGLWSQAPTSNALVGKALIPSCVALRSQIAAVSGNTASPGSTAEGSGYRAHVWTDQSGATNGSGNLYATVIDISNGAEVYSQILLSYNNLSVNPRALILNGVLFVVWGDVSASRHILMRTLVLSSIATVGFTVATALASGAGAGGWATTGAAGSFFACFDVCVNEGDSFGNTWFLAYESVSGFGSTTVLKKYDSTGAQITSTAGLTTLPHLFPFTLQATHGEHVWLSYCRNDAGVMNLLSQSWPEPTLTSPDAEYIVDSFSVVNPPIMLAIARIAANQIALLVFSVASSFSGTRQYHVSVGASTGPGSPGAIGMYPIGKPFTFNGRVLVPMLNVVDLSQASIFLVEVPALVSFHMWRAVARCSVRTAALPAGAPNAPLGVGFDVPALDGTQNFTILVPQAPIQGRTGLAQVTFRMLDSTLWQPAEIGGDTCLSAGVPQFYDGALAAEMGFHVYPSGQGAFTPSTTGGFMEAGSYIYSLVYEWVDANGDVHRSAPSVSPVTVGGTVNGSVTIAFPMYPLSGFETLGAPVKLVVYRSLKTGGVLYRVKSLDSMPNNSPLVLTIPFVDTSSDASMLASNPPLIYTTGGVLPNVCPPSATAMCAHKSRYWLVGDDGRTVWFSRAYTAGEFPGFNELLTFQVSDGGPIVALASLDDKLVIFKSDRIFLVYGDGPSDTGQGSDLTAPQRIASDVGCIEQRSVVLTPMGLMFQSAAGIYLLSRAGELSFAGKNVQATLAANPIITSAALTASQSIVRFSTSTGVTLVYDYVSQEWSTHVYVLGGGPSSYVSSAVQVPSGRYYVAAESKMFAERQAGDGGVYLDDTHWIPLSVETPEIHMAGLQGFQRARSVQVNYESLSAHGLTLSVFTDQSLSPSQVIPWTSTELATLPRREIGARVLNARCGSIRFLISDVAPVSEIIGGGGVVLAGLSLEWIPRTKQNRLAPAARK